MGRRRVKPFHRPQERIDHLQEREQDAQFSKPQSKDHAKERRNVGQQSKSKTVQRLRLTRDVISFISASLLSHSDH